LSKIEWRTTQVNRVSSSNKQLRWPLRPMSRSVSPLQLPAMTLTLSTEMMRLAEDGAICTIARFEKQFSYLQAGPQRNATNRLQVSISDPLGHMTRYEYSALNQLIKVTDPLANFTSFS
jgi:YD repeat-containing protein